MDNKICFRIKYSPLGGSNQQPPANSCPWLPSPPHYIWLVAGAPPGGASWGGIMRTNPTILFVSMSICGIVHTNQAGLVSEKKGNLDDTTTIQWGKSVNYGEGHRSRWFVLSWVNYAIQWGKCTYAWRREDNALWSSSKPAGDSPICFSPTRYVILIPLLCAPVHMQFW